jgi:hypothetical protein
MSVPAGRELKQPPGLWSKRKGWQPKTIVLLESRITYAGRSVLSLEGA